MEKKDLKCVIFSFDDGRKDNYSIAYNIMSKYNLVGTLHVITGCIDNTYQPKSGSYQYLSLENLLKLKNCGFEISSHSNDHSNNYEMIKISLEKLITWNLMDKNFLTFSSPCSEINEKNFKNYKLETLNLKYLRTGIRLHNEKFTKKLSFFLSKFLKSKMGFWYLNKNNIMTKKDNHFFIKSVAIKRHNTVGQIKYLIKKMKPGETIVLLFHTINDKKKIAYDWEYCSSKFEKICQFVSKDEQIYTPTIKDYVVKN